MFNIPLKLNKKFILLFLIGFPFFGISQQVSELPNGVKGYWSQKTLPKGFLKNWEAQWIWLPKDMQKDVMLARRSFVLSEKPKSSKLRITASSKYELFVNGIYVCQGPARSASHHQSFDILEVAPLLRTGKNVIAVKVHYQKGTISYHLEGRAGLLIQLDVENKKPPIITDNNWKVSPDPSWDDNSPAISRFQLVVNDHVDLRNKVQGFETIGFDDSDWAQAQPLLRNSGWPSPKANEKARPLTTPWTSLVHRDIPYLKETTTKAVNLIEAKQVSISAIKNASIELTGTIQKDINKSFKKWLKNKEGFQIPSSEPEKAWFLFFDFGKVLNGMPRLEVQGTQNAEMSILCAPFIVGSKFTHHIVASNFEDKLILSGNTDVWQSMYFKPTRYMAVVIKENPVDIHELEVHQLEYPFELRGSISAPDAPWIEDLWFASAKTINTCTTDAFTDNYRERRQYAQTGYYAALGNYFTFGDTALQRRYLIQVAQEQEAAGLMPAYAPLTGDDYMVILDSNCLWIRSLYNYLLYTGDYITVKRLLPAAKKLMSLLHSFTNNLGLIDNPPYAYWLDHALNDRQGANLCLNGHYLGALKDFSKLLMWMADQEFQEYDNRAELLKESIKTNFWDNDKGLFADALIDGKRSQMFSEHANAMVLAENIANESQAKKVCEQLLLNDNHNYIKRENSMTMVTPAMSYFLHKGLANYGYEEASLKMMYARFKKMLEPHTNGTLWEEWWRNGTGRSGKFFERTRSDAQTESAFPPALFAKFILGVTIIKPGFEEVLIKQPNLSLSENTSSIIPTPLGDFLVSWKTLKKDKVLHLKIPKGITVKLDAKSFNESSIKKIDKDSMETPIKENKSGIIELKEGAFTVFF